MIQTENENSYVFDNDSARRFIERQRLTLPEPMPITDHYLEPQLRVRQTTSPGREPTYALHRKQGNKAHGERTEQEVELSDEAAEMLIPCGHLRVVKRRHRIDMPGFPWVRATFDFVESPMRLAILELETTGAQGPPTARELFGVDLIACPLSAWRFFKRRIGICGGPSAGKSETARLLTHTLNTRFRANAFHVQEFATTFIQKYGRPPGFDDQFLLWHGQKSREQDANSRAMTTVSDCPTFLTYIYALVAAKPALDDHTSLHLAKLYKRVLQDLRGYTDMIFLAVQDYKDNNIRFQTPAAARAISDRVEGFLRDHNVPYREASFQDGRTLLDELFFLNAVEE